MRKLMRHRPAVMCTGTPPAVTGEVAVAREDDDFALVLDSVFRWRRPELSPACCVSLAICALASSSCACSDAEVGRALETLVAAASRVDLMFPEFAGLKVSCCISPRFLRPVGRSAGTETGPAVADTMRWGVTASGEGEDGTRDSRLRPFGCAEVDVESSAGRKRTLIFFSWIDDFEVCSMCVHYDMTVSSVPHCHRRGSAAYRGRTY